MILLSRTTEFKKSLHEIPITPVGSATKDAEAMKPNNVASINLPGTLLPRIALVLLHADFDRFSSMLPMATDENVTPVRPGKTGIFLFCRNMDLIFVKARAEKNVHARRSGIIQLRHDYPRGAIKILLTLTKSRKYE
ncbi:hypothetical protein HZH66_014371 [Vespula vulgaris]|uniref:Uncharacterized protein n=1 Tax=Vespula vulgaris TaxID=7454 RepID=A0A834J0L0_VESVU|nr:hypothetical protein HZH66_014371 [Vespula vulgaris]